MTVPKGLRRILPVILEVNSYDYLLFVYSIHILILYFLLTFHKETFKIVNCLYLVFLLVHRPRFF